MKPLALWLACALACLPAHALAQDNAAEEAERTVARKLGYEGVGLYEEGQYPQAYDALDRAYQILHVPTLGLWSARALVKLGRLVEASERYQRVARDELPDTAPDLHRKAKADAATEREALLPRLAHVTVTLSGVPLKGIEIKLDGRPFLEAMLGSEVPIDPGVAHQFVLTRGSERIERSVTLKEGESQPILFELVPLPEVPPTPPPPDPVPAPVIAPPTPAPPPPEEPIDPFPILGWTGVGLGAAGVIAGAIAAGLAVSKKSDLEASGSCVESVCDTDLQSDVDSYNAARTAATPAFVVGGVLLAGGVLTLLLAPPPEKAKTPNVQPVLGPTWLGLTGRF